METIKLFYLTLTFLFLLSCILEYLFTKNNDLGYYNFKDAVANLKLMGLGILFDVLFKGIAIQSLIYISGYAFFSIEYSWWSWLLCFLLWDFLFYWKHYVEHNIRLLWAIHVNHHSSAFMNLSTALRSGVFKAIYRYFFYIPIILLGFSPIMFFVIYGLGKFWAFFSHSRKLGNWRILGKVLVTPAHHAVHHSCNDENFNKNFGETLIVWDKIFGTYKPYQNDLKYGIDGAAQNSNIYKTIMHEFESMLRDIKSTKNFKKKLQYTFGKPEWNNRNYKK